MFNPHPETWLYPTAQGLYCAPGRFWIDPHLPVDRAVITHGHSDHARSGHGAVLASPETIEIVKLRLGEGGAGAWQAYGGPLDLGGLKLSLVPAGHILGSVQ